MSGLQDFERAAIEDEVRKLKKSLKDKDREIARLEKVTHSAFDIMGGQARIPKWAKKKPTKARGHVGRPVLMLSDLHFQEVVDAREMNGINEYNHEISVARFERVVSTAADWTKKYVAGIDIDGAMVAILGDILTGTIHDEFIDTNDMTTMEAVVFWAPQFVSALEFLADEWGALIVPMLDGNHDRINRGKRIKGRAHDSWTWPFYNWIADRLSDDDRITCLISSAVEMKVPLYDTTFLLEHGDGTSGGNGIGGIWPPIKRHVARSQQRHAALKEPFDVTLMGHWHQSTWGGEFIINGSLKGADEYAMSKGFQLERPQQNLFIVTPENGITMKTEIYAD